MNSPEEIKTLAELTDKKESPVKNSSLDEDLIISKKINECYLAYIKNQHYCLFIPENNKYVKYTVNINDDPDAVDNTIIENENGESISNNNEINGHLLYLSVILKNIGFDKDMVYATISSLFNDLADVQYYVNEEGEPEWRTERFEAISDETLNNLILEISKEITRNKQDGIISYLYSIFKSRKGIKRGERELGNYLNKECGIILRKNIHEIYKLDEVSKGYNSITIDEIITELTEIFGEKNLFKTTDIENAIDFISDRLTPEYNIVKFNNGLYDVNKHMMINPEKPIFTLIESPFNYNPNAKPKFIDKYLLTTFERDSEEETRKEITGVLQCIGYLFTSGNPYQTLMFLIGIGGSGKSTLATIISEIFKGKTTQLDFSKIEKDIHATSRLIGKHLNIVSEAKTDKIVEDITTYKELTGNDKTVVNPKNRDSIEIPAPEVPKTIICANNSPKFENPDSSVLQRLVIIEFKKKFRNTSEVIRDYAKEIINSTDDMEWLIYNSLKAFKEMDTAKKDFTLRVNEEKTMELIDKHANPLNYLLRKLILKHDESAYETDVELIDDEINGETEFKKPYVIADELNRLIVYLSKQEGVQIPLDNHGKTSSRKLLNAIRDEFELHDYYLKTEHGTSKKYGTTPKKINGIPVRVYPELIKTEYYDKLLDELDKKEQENEENNELEPK